MIPPEVIFFSLITTLAMSVIGLVGVLIIGPRRIGRAWDIYVAGVLVATAFGLLSSLFLL